MPRVKKNTAPKEANAEPPDEVPIATTKPETNENVLNVEPEKDVKSEKNSELDEKNLVDDKKYEGSAKPFSEKKVRKKRAPKSDDPQPKKRSKNSFMFFCEDNRARIKETYAPISVTEIAKKLGEEWKELTEELRQPYVDKAQKAKEEFASGKMNEIEVS